MWSTAGNLIVKDLFTWLWEGVEIGDQKDDGIGGLINMEFDMYLHHQRESNGAPNKGWLRTIFYSLIQQLVRQEKAYWILYTCLRPDGNVPFLFLPLLY